ncbi:MAG: hypothetical protein ACLFT2_05760, partial [Candidatus Brocadiia bacterium]
GALTTREIYGLIADPRSGRIGRGIVPLMDRLMFDRPYMVGCTLLYMLHLKMQAARCGVRPFYSSAPE